MKKGISMQRLTKIALVLMLLAVIVVPTFLMATPVAAITTTVNFPVTIRDFHGLGWGNPGSDSYFEHPDFENALGDDRGIVENTLGVDGKPVYKLPSTSTTTHGKSFFDMWYNDTPGYNMSEVITLPFTLNNGVYEYNNTSFFPIDGQLLGNAPNNHNFHFTLEMHTMFTYQGGEVFNFAGDDDVWSFINKQLVIDLGGVHPAESASVALDSLGLTKGTTYNFDLFFAERHTDQSDFAAATTLELIVPPVPELPAGALLGLGLVGVGGFILIRRRVKRVTAK